MTRSAATSDREPPSATPTSDSLATDGDSAGWADELAAVFAAELQEHLSHVPALAALLASPDTQTVACAKLSRIFHTIKGSAAVVGRNELAALAKCLQDEFGAVAEQPAHRPLSVEFFAIVQAALDDLCAAADQAAPQFLHPAVPTRVALSEAPATEATTQEGHELLHAFGIDAAETLETSQRLLLDLERNPASAAILRELFRHFHTLKGAAAAVGLEHAAQQLHHGESLLEAAVEGTIAVETPRLVDFLLRLTDSITGLINTGRGLADRQHTVIEDVEATVAALMGPSSPAASVAPQPDVPSGQHAVEVESTSVRVESTQLDGLMDLVGQLVSARARMYRRVEGLDVLRQRFGDHRSRLAQMIETCRNKYEFSTSTSTDPARSDTDQRNARGIDVELDRYNETDVLARGVVELAASSREVAEQVGRAIDALSDEIVELSQITSALQRGIGRLRSVPLDTVLRRLARAVREAARHEGKVVDLHLDGGATEVDKAIVDRLHAPLLHLVRNAVAHGIELPAVRQACGKPPSGTIRITATLHSRSLLLAVEDDGAGIDYDAIESRARALGLIPAGERWQRDRLLGLIFRPGFSTQAAVSDLSGRGVGMDAVAADIAALNGSITIDSHAQRGTVVRITVPTTTSIDEVLLLQAGTQLFALPVGLVEQVTTVDVSDLLRRRPQTVTVRDTEVPALFLAPLVGEPAPLDQAAAVVLRMGGHALALVVDRVQAQHEAVIRPLGPLLEGHPLLSGAVVSATGAVILSLHTGRLLELATSAGDGQTQQLVRSPQRNAGSAILFVDDSISVRKVATHFLEASGIEVDTAVDGLDAVEKLATGRFRLVVTDLEMPRMHGYELIAAIRRDPRFEHLPVVVCSSRSSDKHRQRATEMGAQGYLTKPFTHDELLAEIHRLSRAQPDWAG